MKATPTKLHAKIRIQRGAGDSSNSQRHTSFPLSQADPSSLRADYDAWSSLALSAWTRTEAPWCDRENYNRIVLVGMGGSLLAGELILDISKETKSTVSFETLKDYNLPEYCDDRTLVIGMSSSGNTEETLSALSEAHKRGIHAYNFGSGGTLESFSKNKWRYQFVRTTMLKVPRSSLPGMFYPVLKFLMENHILNLSSNDVEESIDSMKVVTDRITNASNRNEALSFARKLVPKNKPTFPLLYSSVRTRAVGLRARQSMNENAKVHAFNGEIPELCHNEIVGWDSIASKIRGPSAILTTSDATAILLRLGNGDTDEVRTRFDIVEEIIKKARGKVLKPPYSGRSYLSRIMTLLLFLDYVTYYMAILRGIDPIKTPSIDLLKQQLASRLDFISHI